MTVDVPLDITTLRLASIHCAIHSPTPRHRRDHYVHCPIGELIIPSPSSVMESGHCSPCDSGKYSGAQNSLACDSCPVGTYSGASASACTDCEVSHTSVVGLGLGSRLGVNTNHGPPHNHPPPPATIAYYRPLLRPYHTHVLIASTDCSFRRGAIPTRSSRVHATSALKPIPAASGLMCATSAPRATGGINTVRTEP